MLYLIYGPESFLAHEKLGFLKSRFEKSSKSASLNLHTLDFSEEAWGEALELLGSVSFLGDQRSLVVLRGFLKGLNEKQAAKLKGFLEKIADDSTLIVVFYEVEELGKSKFGEWLKNKSTTFYAAPLGPRQREKWLEKRFEAAGCEVGKDTLSFLASLNEDLWYLDQEANKLITCGQPINRDLVGKLVCEQGSVDIFEVTDQLLARNHQVALVELLRLLDSGEPAYKLLGTMHFYLNALLLVKALKEKGKERGEIASLSGLHPYVIKKISDRINKWPEDLIKKYIFLLGEADRRLKQTQLAPELVMTDLVSRFENLSV